MVENMTSKFINVLNLFVYFNINNLTILTFIKNQQHLLLLLQINLNHSHKALQR